MSGVECVLDKLVGGVECVQDKLVDGLECVGQASVCCGVCGTS